MSPFRFSGVVLGQFADLAGPVGFIQQNGGEQFRMWGRFDSPAVVFPRSHSILRVRTGREAKGVQRLDTSMLWILPARTRFEISGATPLCYFSLLLFSQKLLARTATTYRLPVAALRRLLAAGGPIRRRTWLGELIYRYGFERAIAGGRQNVATRFLEPEILKELYYARLNEEDPRHKHRYPFDPDTLQTKSGLLRKALVHIEVHLFHAITMEDLTRHCAASKATLTRAFQKEFGMAPFEFIRDRRLQEADVMLLNAGHSVGDVATHVGFSDASAFIHAYRRKFGVTPARARRGAS